LLTCHRPSASAQQDFAGSSVEVRLDERLSAGLKALSQRHGVTLFMTLMSAWSLLLSRLSGQSDVVIGSPVANRTRAEIEGLIGMFVNTLALRIDTSGEPSVGAAGTGQGAHAGGAGASGSAVRASGGHRPAGAQSGAQPAVPDHAELGQQRRPEPGAGRSELEAWPRRAAAKFDLTLTLGEVNG
jgi:arthrofactin-type cyclic lipopeptide synthetase C